MFDHGEHACRTLNLPERTWKLVKGSNFAQTFRMHDSVDHRPRRLVGADTKILLNGGNMPSKRFQIERETNFNVIVNSIVLIPKCTITAVANCTIDLRTGKSAAVFEADSEMGDSDVVNALVSVRTGISLLAHASFWLNLLYVRSSCLIAFQSIMPISLYISIEIIKMIQTCVISEHQ